MVRWVCVLRGGSEVAPGLNSRDSDSEGPPIRAGDPGPVRMNGNCSVPSEPEGTGRPTNNDKAIAASRRMAYGERGFRTRRPWR